MKRILCTLSFGKRWFHFDHGWQESELDYVTSKYTGTLFF